ncbi:hypothetical protein [Streptococcus agalactiae]|uniref:hypothetical protein n=1 Tax=Streptococcus agalactiae TaxID=1311 RepID=UPI00085BEA7D|nr:hypothetical protein [Streptococcus agalactiae]
MALYKATKNLVFQNLDKAVIVDEVIELETDYAEKVNKELKLTFPDVAAVLVLVDETVEEKPKKTTRKKKADDTETVEEAVE